MHTPLAGALLGIGDTVCGTQKTRKLRRCSILGHFFELLQLHSQLLVVLHVYVHTTVQTHTEQVVPSTKSLWSPAHLLSQLSLSQEAPPSALPEPAKHLGNTFTLGLCSLSSSCLSLSLCLCSYAAFRLFQHEVIAWFSWLLCSVFICCE